MMRFIEFIKLSAICLDSKPFSFFLFVKSAEAIAIFNFVIIHALLVFIIPSFVELLVFVWLLL